MRRCIAGWSIGRKTLASHLIIASLSIAIATALCMSFVDHYTCEAITNELSRQATAIARQESRVDDATRASRRSAAEMYQELTNSAVFFVNQDGEAVKMRRYAPSTETDAEADSEDFSTVELYDVVDRQFVDRVMSGETVTAVRRFVFAGGVVVFAGAPICDDSGATNGGVILAQPVTVMRAISREAGGALFAASSIAICLSILLAAAQARMLVRPIQRMTRAARTMVDGCYGCPIAVETDDEIGELGRTLNTLSARLAQTIRSLREECDRLELVVGSIGEGILALDREMRVVHCNRAFLEMMELETVGALFDVQRGDAADLLEAFRNTMLTGERRRASWVNPSGRAIHAEISALPEPSGGPLGAVCLLADVSEAQRLEQLRRDYVANVSHELRTPLTGIRGMIEPLIDGCVESEAERQAYYLVIQRETIRLQKMVGDMLDISRLQDGRIAVELERMELPGILAAAKRSMASIAAETGVEMRIETDGSALECMGNEDRIMQVLIILLDNALDFTPSGGRITLFARDGGRHVLVGVRDTGCGIEPKDLPLIWERFYKADRSRMRTKGTGLGLAIAKLVVELMGGEIHVDSEPGRGSEFVFTLEKPKGQNE